MHGISLILDDFTTWSLGILQNLVDGACSFDQNTIWWLFVSHSGALMLPNVIVMVSSLPGQ